MQLRHQLTSIAAALVVLALVDMPQPLLAQSEKNAKDTKGAATLVWPLPPEKPPSRPPLASTRWHGTTTGIGLDPQA